MDIKEQNNKYREEADRHLDFNLFKQVKATNQQDYIHILDLFLNDIKTLEGIINNYLSLQNKYINNCLHEILPILAHLNFHSLHHLIKTCLYEKNKLSFLQKKKTEMLHLTKLAKLKVEIEKYSLNKLDS